MAVTSSSPHTPNSEKPNLNIDNSEAIQYHWPEDVIIHILVRLPAKSILRFKSVCKRWYSLIQSSFFTELHSLFHNEGNRNKLFYCWSGEDTYNVYTTDSSSPYLSESTPIFDVEKLVKALIVYSLAAIVSSFECINSRLACDGVKGVYELILKVLGPLENGIYCVIAEVKVLSVFAFGYCRPAFCNPATGEFKLLGIPPIMSFGYEKQYYGFGSIHKGDSVVDYKMVLINQTLHQFRVYLYSLRRGWWKRISDGWAQFPTITQDLDFLPQALLKGSCHWMAEGSVLRFNLSKEVFGSIPGPPIDDFNLPDDDDCWVKRGVFAYDDHLFAMIMIYDPISPGDINHEIAVWMVKEYGVGISWTKIHSCKFLFWGELNKFMGMFFSGDSCMTIEKMFFQGKGGMLLSCDCSACTLRKHNNVINDYHSSWVCWKTIGISTNGQTLEPLSLNSNDEDMD